MGLNARCSAINLHIGKLCTANQRPSRERESQCALSSIERCGEKNDQPLQKWVTRSLHSKSEFVRRRKEGQPRSKCICATGQQRTKEPAQDTQPPVAQHMKIHALHCTSIFATTIVYKGTGRRITISFTKKLADASQYFGMLVLAAPQRLWLFPSTSRPQHYSTCSL